MQPDTYPAVSLHNVAELEAADWTDDGHRLTRLPGDVGANLNVSARERMRHPSGCELRFVPDGDDATVAITLSASTETVAYPFWGSFQAFDRVAIGPEPITLEFTVPERVRALEPQTAAAGAFDPRVCRLRFDPRSPVALHDVAGPRRPPTADELPATRYLAYGTSITEGYEVAPHLCYVAQTARRLGVDPINLGLSGAAFCEPAMADYLAGRNDWDLATLSLSVNMANRGFTLEQFRERAGHLVQRVATAHPEKPIACVTLFPYHADVVRGDDRERAAEFRAALRSIVGETAHDDLHLLEGPDLLDPTGLTSDVLHPGDDGMIQIGQRLAAALRPVLE